MNAFFELRIQISHERERASKRVREREREREGGRKGWLQNLAFRELNSSRIES